MSQTRALIVGASGGVGEAMSTELKRRGADVTRLSRRQHGLDITCEESVQTHLDVLDPEFDLVVVATGILTSKFGPEKSLNAVTAQEMADLFAVNAIGPALVLKHAKRLMPRKRRAVFAALSARVGSIGDNALGGWYSYRTSKAALNQVIRTASIELGRTHKHLVCCALHPGTVATDFTQNYPNHKAVSPQQAAANLIRVIDSRSLEDTGHFFDWSGAKVPW